LATQWPPTTRINPKALIPLSGFLLADNLTSPQIVIAACAGVMVTWYLPRSQNPHHSIKIERYSIYILTLVSASGY